MTQFCGGFPEFTSQYISYVTTSCFRTSNSLFINAVILIYKAVLTVYCVQNG